MMKNRDTPSNPYHVPRQPTAQWIKVSIVMLFLCNATLMGGVVYLVFASRECTKACVISSERTVEKILKQSSPDVMKDGVIENPITRQEENMRKLAYRVNSAADVIAGVQANVRRLEEMCRKQATSVGTLPKDSADTTSLQEHSYPRQNNIQEVVTKMELKIASITVQLEKLETTSRQLCKKGHYRFGVYCLYVGEAALPQANAKRLCLNDYGAEGTLVVIKDRLMHEFVSTKIPNRRHSYWVGIERPQARVRSDTERGGGVGVPERALLPGPSPSGVSSFEYADGTRVQNAVWQVWDPDQVNNDHMKRDCVALSFDHEREEWYWQDHDCEAKLGYVCQYFVMSVER